ncbi:MAG TPA: FAD-dependent monooxygenase [Streptosporangiaceae bacterium]|nr:FAD-dependent monooxygenase [Streptosporangiaceae bacterium]
MKIVCVGGGPAGLYVAISAKLRDPGHQITVLERDPPMATYGWGVVYWEPMLDMLHRNDPESAREISARSVLWQDQQIRVHGADQEGTAFFAGYGYSMGRAALLDLLSRRASELGVKIDYGCQVQEPSGIPEADLVVAADGAGSRIRKVHGEHFGTQIQPGRNPYIWFGTDKVFTSLVFCFEQTSAGWIWFYACPSSGGISNCIVECSPETWRGLGLDQLGAEDGVRLLEKIFHGPLDGHSLISSSRGEPARWQTFAQVSNQTWYHGRTVLAGDAAHTTHFTLGSGTWLAMTDAVVLAHSLSQYPDVDDALREYDQHRRAELARIQAAARASMAWYEDLDRYLAYGPVSFAYALSVRHGNHSPWRYRRHLATQFAAVRSLRRACNSGQRWYLARRRGKAAPGALGMSRPTRI